ncbi:MAG TPA: DEAD/DEAH box helicase [Planctomycetaceae bacterium]|nr:DEAD/DEAH box helicase [Planctomycetaceae bacterium]
MQLKLHITPSGRIVCEPETDLQDEALSGVAIDETTCADLLRAFGDSTSAGLLSLAGVSNKVPLPLSFVFWRNWSLRFLKAVANLDDEHFAALEKSAKAAGSKSSAKNSQSQLAPPDDLALAVTVAEAPPMLGLEYLTNNLLKTLWAELLTGFLQRAADTDGGCRGLLLKLNPDAHLLGRVTFHLAENKRDPDAPFAFLATYAHRLSAKSQVQHLPLGEALRQYAAERDQTKLAELLAPVREAANRSKMVGQLLSSRAIFKPQAWPVSQAFRFLSDVAVMEEAGLSVRVPDWWKTRKVTRPQVQVRIGDQKASAVGLDSLLDFSANLAVDGTPLTDEERQQLLAATDGLTLLRGKWVEVDQQKLQEALDHWKELLDEHADGISFLEGMRLLAGTQLETAQAADDDALQWSSVTSGEWLAEILRSIRDPSGIVGCEPGDGLNATLRPYQSDGVRWLWFMTQLGLGACLADDMGLGKTIQVIDLILRLKEADAKPQPSKNRRGKPENESAPFLLIVPASLIGNWKQELDRFAPQLNVFLAHRSECDAATLDRIAKQPATELAAYDVVVTTYTLIRRSTWPTDMHWRMVVLDEAQAIKNAGSAQSKSVRKLKASGRIALTGTPVENQLGDLWSLFDFCVPGLLGSVKQFRDFVKAMTKQQNSAGVSALRKLVRPYILRRMKTDPNIVQDLPDKTEVRVECGLSKKQAVLYEKLVADVAKQLADADGIQRRGLVLSMLMRLKQLCNHPDQFLSQTAFDPAESGKFQSLRNICEPIRERQEKMLVFTQFQSMCDPLAEFLTTQFHKPGLVLHGGVPVAKRKHLVQQFQEQDNVPFFVISVKAGGTGLNLTAASHVIHFDRWWNPAVENQATDRAYRIGQKRNVLVHKFVCKGTLEERIDQMIRDKQELADNVLGEGSETLLTEMSDSELMKFVALDVTRATLDD